MIVVRDKDGGPVNAIFFERRCRRYKIMKLKTSTSVMIPPIIPPIIALVGFLLVCRERLDGTEEEVGISPLDVVTFQSLYINQSFWCRKTKCLTLVKFEPSQRQS